MDIGCRTRLLRRATWAAALALAPACTLQDFDELGAAYVSPAAGAAGNGGASGAGSGGLDAGGGGGGAAGASGNPVNLIANPSFEAGHLGWTGFGDSTILDVSTGARTGDKCIASMNRLESWQGPSFNVLPLVSADGRFQMGAWVRLESGSAALTLSLKSLCDDATVSYTQLVSVQVSTEWTPIDGLLPIASCTLTELSTYFEGPPADTVFYVDDVSLTQVP